jgi:hypothetical protein
MKSDLDQPSTNGLTPPVSPSASRSRRAWTGFIEAVRFLLPSRRREFDTDLSTRGRLTEAVHWIVPIGLLTGLLWAATFRLSWRVYGEIASMRVVPALVVVLLECLLTGPFLALGLARTVHLLAGRSPLRADADTMAPLSPVGTLILCLTVMSQWALIVSVPAISPWWPPLGDWRHKFTFMYPAPLYRPLVLAPLWGRWAILLAACVGRTARDADVQVQALAGAVGPALLLRHSLLPMGLTAIYCSRDQNLLLGVIIGLLVFAASYLVTVIMARRGGGQTRQSLFAAGQIGQLAFLACYRACWPLMHG